MLCPSRRSSAACKSAKVWNVSVRTPDRPPRRAANAAALRRNRPRADDPPAAPGPAGAEIRQRAHAIDRSSVPPAVTSTAAAPLPPSTRRRARQRAADRRTTSSGSMTAPHPRHRRPGAPRDGSTCTPIAAAARPGARRRVTTSRIHRRPAGTASASRARKEVLMRSSAMPPRAGDRTRGGRADDHQIGPLHS